jgi:SAM-dependent methyltransferase
VVADVGSGPGILSRMLVVRGHRVLAVVPNREMREAAERALAARAGFTSIDGTAEATALDDVSVDLVTAAQSFHWFRPTEARREFARILRPPRRVALIWNVRRTEGSYLSAYEDLLQRFGTDYAQVDHRLHSTPERLHAFFGGDRYTSARFDHEQRLDWDGVRGRALSASYVPAAGPAHETFLRELERLFRDHAVAGAVRIEYDTTLHFGTLG